MKIRVCVYNICACMLSRFSQVWLFATTWTVATRILCPWDSPGKNTGACCHGLLEGIFPTQGWRPTSLRFPALASRFFTTGVIWEFQTLQCAHTHTHTHTHAHTRFLLMWLWDWEVLQSALWKLENQESQW